MEYKKIIIPVILAIFLFSITSVCAGEIDTAIASEDSKSMNLSVGDENVELTEIMSVQNEDTLSLNQGNYSDLAEEIQSGGNVELKYDYYTYDSGFTITITGDNRVIDGKGAVIDMAGSNMRAFYVSDSGVTIKNLIIKNTNYDNNGGAIFFHGSGTVINCNFTNNTITGEGDAIYFYYNGTVTNCHFTGNTAGDAGAIRMNSGNVSNCNFTNNKVTGAYSYGGAVYFSSSGNVSNCNFTNNTATGAYSYGGAVYFSSPGNVSNCNFNNNNATGNSAYGGAVYFTSNGEVSNCNFNNNNATGENSHGGAIWMASGNVSNCNFNNNKANGTVS